MARLQRSSVKSYKERSYWFKKLLFMGSQACRFRVRQIRHLEADGSRVFGQAVNGLLRRPPGKMILLRHYIAPGARGDGQPWQRPRSGVFWT